MNEAMERNEEAVMNDVSENIAENEEVKQADERENAPREDLKPAHRPDEDKKKGKKKRKKRGMSVGATAALLVIALAFGAVIGYGYGRSVGAERLADAQADVQALVQALEEAQGLEVYAGFDDALTEENLSALNDLAGAEFANDDVASVLMGEDSLQGASIQSAQESVVVAEYSGGQIMSDEAAREYEEQMANLIFAGYSEDEISEDLLGEVLRDMVAERVLEAHAKEMGLYELTDADRAGIEAEARAAYDEQVAFYRDYVNADFMSEEEANGAAKAYLQENEGVSLESVKQDLETTWWKRKIFDEITKDVSIDEAALQAAYDEKLAEQKESFTAYADDYEFAQMNGDIIVYNLPGYRAVRMIALGLDDVQAYEDISLLRDEIAALNPETDAGEIAARQAEIDAIYAPAEEKAKAALAEIQAGADFADVLKSYGEDEGMKDENLAQSGYYVARDSLLWPAEMISAAMALETPGDVSGIVRMADGVCILEFVGAVDEGEVALENVRVELEQEALESAKYEAYQAQIGQWLEAAGAAYYPERMQ